MEEINIKELFDYFKNRITWIIIAVILVVAIGNIVTIITRVPMYKSSTTIVLVSEEGYNDAEQQLNKSLVSTYAEIIKSRKVLNEVIDNLGLNYQITTLSENISVSAVENTEIIRITVSDSENSQATKIANEIATVFTKEIQKIYRLNNVSVIDKAESSISPYNINYLKDNFIYMAIGLVLSCGIIFIMFYFDNTIRTGDEIESKLGLTIIGVVPNVERN